MEQNFETSIYVFCYITLSKCQMWQMTKLNIFPCSAKLKCTGMTSVKVTLMRWSHTKNDNIPKTFCFPLWKVLVIWFQIIYFLKNVMKLKFHRVMAGSVVTITRLNDVDCEAINLSYSKWNTKFLFTEGPLSLTKVCSLNK